MKQYISAGIVVYRHKSQGEKEYLLLKYAAGHWGFPKGKVEQGESLIDTAVRELKEETGLNVQLDQGFKESFSFLFDDRDGSQAKKEVVFFAGCLMRHGEVRLSDEHTQSEWLSYEQAFERLTYSTAQKVLHGVEHYLDIKE